jgi:hypothetical protein
MHGLQIRTIYCELAEGKRTKEKGNLKNVNLFPKKIWRHCSPCGDFVLNIPN